MSEQVRPLSKLAHELDFELGAMDVTLGQLSDASILMGQLQDSMDIAAYKGEERAFFREHHRMVRVLSAFIRYSLNDLSRDFEKASKIREQIFSTVKGGHENE